MFKSLLIIILVAAALWLVRSIATRTQNRPGEEAETKVTENKNTVQCLQCKTYIPTDEAIIKDGKSFCSTQHLEQWDKSA